MSNLESTNGPVKVYCEEWYQQHRPQHKIDHTTKVVDPQLVAVLNRQSDIEKGLNQLMSESHRAPLTR